MKHCLLRRPLYVEAVGPNTATWFLGRRLAVCRRPVHLTESEARMFVRLSEALFADEAGAMSVSLKGSSSCLDWPTGGKSEEEGCDANIATDEIMNMIMNPPIRPGASFPDERIKVNSDSKMGATALVEAVRQLGHDEESENPQCISAALSGAMCALISSDASDSINVASQLLLAGTDLKVIITDGALRDMRIEGKCMSRCDFSTLSLLSIHAERVDFSRSLFYASAIHNCEFKDCLFDGCVLKELRCSGSVRFEKCSFRFASVSLRISSVGSSSTLRKAVASSSGMGRGTAKPAVIFDRCDFDLSDFDGCDNLPACCFVDCSNTHLASKFSSCVGGG